jgi:tetratricopeptide (TPR) repeat protein
MRWLVAGFAALLVSQVAVAQSDTSTAQGPEPLLAHRLSSLARLSLMGQANPLPEQVDRAVILIDQATRLDPGNAELWRLKAEALQLEDDPAAIADVLRTYIRLRPEDDRGQLLLISRLAEQQQTIDHRMGFYQRLLEGKSAERLTAALRSRLASRLAMLVAEQGDMVRYRELLAEALERDSTNKAAAIEIYADRIRSDKPLDQVASALFTVFNADPTDSQTHALIAGQLLRCGQYEQAMSWFESASTLRTARGQSLDMAMAETWGRAMWGSGQGEQVLQLVGQVQQMYENLLANAERQVRSQQIAEFQADLEAQGLEPRQMTEEEFNALPSIDRETLAAEAGLPEAWPPVSLQVLRLLILHGSGNDAMARDAFLKLEEDISTLLADEDIEPAARTDLLIALAWSHLICDQNIQDVPSVLKSLEEASTIDPAMLQAMRGWLALRQGLDNKAREMLVDVGESASAYADYGLYLVDLKKGVSPEAQLERLNAIHQTSPASVAGLLAVAQIRKLGQPLTHTNECQRVAAVFEQVPDDLRRIVDHPRQYIMLTANLDQYKFSYTEPITVNVSVRNVGRIPLSMGPDGSITGNLFFVPNVTFNGQPVPNIAPVVVDMARRLRLEPGRSLSVTTRVDAGQLGLLLRSAPAVVADLRTSAVLNPAIMPNGAIAPGVLGTVAHMRPIERQTWVPSDANFTQLMVQLSGSDSRRTMNAAAILMQMAAGTREEDDEGMQRAARWAEAVNRAFPELNPVEQAWAASFIPRLPHIQPLFEPTLTAANRSDNTLVRLALLATQVTETDSPVLNAALRMPEGPVREYARATLNMLEQIDEPPAAAATGRPEVGTE